MAHPLFRFTPLCLTLAIASCLDIHRVPARETDAGDAAVVADASSYDGGACNNACIDKTPEGGAKFKAVAQCITEAQNGVCAASCEPDAGLGEPTQCSVPSLVSPIPACNACLKDQCCDALVACLAESSCVVVALCAQACTT